MTHLRRRATLVGLLAHASGVLVRTVRSSTAGRARESKQSSITPTAQSSELSFMGQNSQGPRLEQLLNVTSEHAEVIRKAERARAENRARAGLWNAVWNASQFMTASEIIALVERTCMEIQSDDP
jgi:hypothetical protein